MIVAGRVHDAEADHHVIEERGFRDGDAGASEIIADISLASSLPMIQVNRVCGQASCRARSAAAAWQVSPMAERRSRQTLRGSGSKRCGTGKRCGIGSLAVRTRSKE